MMSQHQNPLDQIFVDISLFAESTAYGRISGFINIPFIPEIGDSIYFDFNGMGANLPNGSVFVATCKVENRLIRPGLALNEVVFDLGNITVDTIEDAKSVMDSFRSNYDLFGEPYGL